MNKLLLTSALLMMFVPSYGRNAHKGKEYVDLGLSVKWATCNVGAQKPEESGDYLAWGETAAKDSYSFSTYKHSVNGSRLTKYNSSATIGYNGFSDNKTNLELADDAASVLWGGKWRMPTMSEFDELRNNCNWTWTTQNGVAGYLITSKKEGFTDCSIFLPAAGYKTSGTLNNNGSQGCYWSSMCDDGMQSDGAFYLCGESRRVYNARNLRCNGMTVRPVLP